MALVYGFQPAFLPPSIPGSHLALRLHVRALLIALSALATVFTVQYRFIFFSSWTTSTPSSSYFYVKSEKTKGAEMRKCFWRVSCYFSFRVFYFPELPISRYGTAFRWSTSVLFPRHRNNRLFLPTTSSQLAKKIIELNSCQSLRAHIMKQEKEERESGP